MTEFFNDLWATAKQAGPFASLMLLLILYFVNEERKTVTKENKSLQEKNQALVERLLTGLHDVNDTLKDLREVLFRAGPRKR